MGAVGIRSGDRKASRLRIVDDDFGIKKLQFGHVEILLVTIGLCDHKAQMFERFAGCEGLGSIFCTATGRL